mmetsp:Transcript_9117/g.20287  ORF Transcript_9117/g.20287 Transcript_9117/m.20287 type:complete len:472 (-) Transcript_9117:75-1490(-)
MKIQVTVNISSQSKAPATLEMFVTAMDTVADVKQRISSTAMVPFPDQQLFFQDTVLKDEQKLGTCGVREGSCLIYQVMASASALAQQLSDLLQASALSMTELTYLYSHKHGVTVGDALAMVGCKSTSLEAFLQEHKFHFNKSGAVEVPKGIVNAKEDRPGAQQLATLPEFDLAILVNSHLPSRLGISEEVVLTLMYDNKIGDIKQRVVEALSLPLEDVDLLMNGRLMEDENTILAAHLDNEENATLDFAYHCSERVLAEQLTLLLKEDSMTVSQVTQAYNCRFGLNVQSMLRSLSRPEKKLEDFLQRMECFNMENGKVSVAKTLQAPAVGSLQQLTSLHATLSQELKSDSYVLDNQESDVKAVAHLLKYWSSQQKWGSAAAQPSSEFLEMVALHSAQRQSQAESLDVRMLKALQLLACVDELKAGRSTTAPAIVNQRPLLPDPADAARNVADTSSFDPRELMAFARKARVQ